MSRIRTAWSAPLLACALAACTPAHDAEKPEPSIGVHSELQPSAGRAKNVILFIGDGMGISTVTAARIFEGQAMGLPGEAHALSFERFPQLALIKTYNSNQQVPDSAGTATAITSGIKTRAGVIGIGPGAERRRCRGSLEHSVPTIGELAEQHGKATGVVTTTRVTHATPAAVYAHSPERDWESDRYMSEEVLNQGCRDIARQLAEFSFGDGLDVVLGGGRRQFYGSDGNGERRVADADLVARWLAGGEQRVHVRTAEELQRVSPGQQVLGLFADDNLKYMADRTDSSSEPTLSEMTAAAIDLLAGHAEGYFLLVEGGRIDQAHHEGRAGYALTEVRELAHAVEVALARVDLSDTLILVTADHSHTLTIAGYPTLGNPILGLVTLNDQEGNPEPKPALARDGKPFTTLGYMNGPGAVSGGERPVPETGLHARQQALYPTTWRRIDGTDSAAESHSGEDVALYAIGPGSHLVRGVLEQNTISGIMTSAFGWSDDQSRPEPHPEHLELADP